MSSSEIAISPYIPPYPIPDVAFPVVTLESSIYPFQLYEMDKLVIPQKPLYAVYALVIKRLGQYRGSRLFGEKSHKAESEVKVAKDVDDITKIVLLQNPEYAKALNIRKRLIVWRIEHAAQKHDSCGRDELLNDELHLVKLLLGVAANAKMAPLWHHRKWLLDLLFRLPLSEPWSQKRSHLYSIPPMLLSRVILDEELALVERCAQRYPRNYQAWAYRSWLLYPYADTPSVIFCDDPSKQKEVARDPIIEEEVHYLRRHLGTNITDHTAVMHVLRLLMEGKGQGCKNDMAEFALDLVRRYPSRETPWLFLRGMVRLAVKGWYETDAARCLAEEVIERTSSTTKVDSEAVPGNWQLLEDASSRILARRNLFYFHAVEDDTEKGLGSVQCRELLASCR